MHCCILGHRTCRKSNDINLNTNSNITEIIPNGRRNDGAQLLKNMIKKIVKFRICQWFLTGGKIGVISYANWKVKLFPIKAGHCPNVKCWHALPSTSGKGKPRTVAVIAKGRLTLFTTAFIVKKKKIHSWRVAISLHTCFTHVQ